MKVLTAAVCFALASTLVPESGKGQFGLSGPTPRYMIVSFPEVQKELKLTGDQKKKLQDAMQTQPNASGAPGAGLSALKQMDEACVAVLDEDQRRRLLGLSMQYNQGSALEDLDVANLLELTEEQRSKVKEVAAEYASFIMANVQTIMKDSKKRRQARDQNSAALRALLTEPQKLKWTEAVGKKIKFSMEKGF